MAMTVSVRDKTVSHLHTDPKLITQIGCQSTLKVGQFVYLDTDDLYKPGLSGSSKQKTFIHGYVWSFIDEDHFYLRMSVGPVKYRFPFGPEFFLTNGDGTVDEYNVNPFKIPGNIGDRLWLSETEPGGVQIFKPKVWPLAVGFKTEFGLYYRPDTIFCCNIEPTSSISSMSSSLSSLISSESSFFSSLTSSSESPSQSSSLSIASSSQFSSNFSSSSNSSEEIKHCYYLYTSSYDCNTSDWTSPILVQIICSVTGPGEPLGVWVKTGCVAHYWQIGILCDTDSSGTSLESFSSGSSITGSEGGCPVVLLPPTNKPVAVQGDHDACCGSSSESNSINHSSSSNASSEVFESSSSELSSSESSEESSISSEESSNISSNISSNNSSVSSVVSSQSNSSISHSSISQSSISQSSISQSSISQSSTSNSNNSSQGSSNNSGNSSSGPGIPICVAQWRSVFNCSTQAWSDPAISIINPYDCSIGQVLNVWELVPTSSCVAHIYTTTTAPVTCNSSVDCETQDYVVPVNPTDQGLEPLDDCCPSSSSSQGSHSSSSEQLCDQYTFFAEYDCSTNTWNVDSVPVVIHNTLCSSNVDWHQGIVSGDCSLDTQIYVSAGSPPPPTPTAPTAPKPDLCVCSSSSESSEESSAESSQESSVESSEESSAESSQESSAQSSKQGSSNTQSSGTTSSQQSTQSSQQGSSDQSSTISSDNSCGGDTPGRIIYGWETVYNQTTCTWGSVTGVYADCTENTFTFDQWLAFGDACTYRYYTRLSGCCDPQNPGDIPPYPAAPDAPTFQPVGCECVSSSSTSSTQSSEESSNNSSEISSSVSSGVSSIVSSASSATSSTISSESSNNSSETTSSASGLCDIYSLAAFYWCDEPGGCNGSFSWFVSVVSSSTDQECGTDTPWQLSDDCNATKTVYVPAGTPFTNQPCIDYYPDIGPGPTCCPSSMTSSEVSSASSVNSQTSSNSSQNSSETVSSNSSTTNCDFWYFHAVYNCETSAWELDSDPVAPLSTDVPCDSNDGWQLSDDCTAFNGIYVPTGSGKPSAGLPGFGPGPTCCSSVGSSEQSSTSSASNNSSSNSSVNSSTSSASNDSSANSSISSTNDSSGTPPGSSDSSADSSETSSGGSIDPCTDGPDTLTYNFQSSGGDTGSSDCNCTTTQIYKKTASTATTVTYSLIYAESQNDPFPPDGLTCQFCAPTGVYTDDPTNTSPDWVWDCTLGQWTTGGWCAVDNSCNCIPNQFTGGYTLVQDQCGYPFASTLTTTVS